MATVANRHPAGATAPSPFCKLARGAATGPIPAFSKAGNIYKTSMGYRRGGKNNGLAWVEAVGTMAIVLVGVWTFAPGFRIVLIGIGLIVFALAAVLAVGLLTINFLLGKVDEEPSGDRILAPAASRALTAAWANTQSPKPEAGAPIDRLREIDWYQFERFVAYVYEKRGFKVNRTGGANPDGGIDMVIEKDGQKAAVQCKQWKTREVGVKAIREFLGALTDSNVQRGIFITLEGYTGDAKQLAEKHGIEIINEAGLRQMVQGLDLGDAKIKEIFDDTRKICPKCERPLVVRTARFGGNKFWGCSGFPQGCRFTMPI